MPGNLCGQAHHILLHHVVSNADVSFDWVHYTRCSRFPTCELRYSTLYWWALSGKNKGTGLFCRQLHARLSKGVHHNARQVSRMSSFKSNLGIRLIEMCRTIVEVDAIPERQTEGVQLGRFRTRRSQQYLPCRRRRRGIILIRRKDAGEAGFAAILATA